MKSIVCAVFDVKAAAYLQPFFVLNENMARRSFGDAVLDSSTGISKHPSDYKLYALAEFDDISGVFKSAPNPIFLANATDFGDVSTKGGAK